MPGSIQMRGSMNMRGAIVPTIYMGSSTPQSQGGLSYMTRYDSQNAEEKGKEKHYTSPTSVLEGPGVSPNSARSTWSLESSGEPVTLRSQTASRRVDFSAADPTLLDDEDVIEKGNQPVKKQKIDKGGHFEVSSFPARRLVRGKRIYDSLLGRTCHWCRQKTVEHHVICSTCPIQFCGPCLLNRHGEHILEEMREGVNWVCPRCRGGCGPGCSNCCNCGPCRRAQGLPPTGQLVKEARGAGFTNVHDFLVSQFTGECQEQIALRKVGRNWTVDPNNADLKYREPKKLSSDWNPSQFQGSQTEEACGQIGISTPRMRGAISRPFMTMKDKFHTPSGCSGPTTAACSQLPNHRNQKSSDNFDHSSAGLISDDDKKSVIALPTSSDKMNLTVEIKHCGEFTDCNRPLVDLPDLRNPHSHSSDGSLATSLPTYHKERVSRFEEKTATESVYRPDKEALDRKVAFVGVKQEASCFVHKAFGEVTEVREEIVNGSSRIRIPTLKSSDLTFSSFAPSATPLVKGQAVESKSAVEEQKVAIKRLDDSATPNAEGMCSGNENQCSCRHLSRSREVSQLSEEVIDLSKSINAYSNDLQPRPSCCRIVRSLGTAKTETRTSPEIATSMSTVDHSNIVTLSEPSISSSIEDKSGRTQNLTVLIKTTAENITKKEKTTEKISVPGMKEATAFNERLRAVFDEPFNMHELAQLWEQISHRKPVTRQRETRRGSFEVTTNEEGLSYLDHHPDLGLKLSTTVDPEVKLQMLRGFFCWLQKKDAEGQLYYCVDMLTYWKMLKIRANLEA
ncbi:hypothetical protein O6H91_01G051700 [Diphasiastrum complanatum]|uniref:Uncharacterized protein n=1 Tax=Diphasiastrum complanatum TaxID=34168 RepID=A0ACC2EQY9_DIPCM|nr:hypothetical protein O6H91_01G051700 [Diphasiastrum complanatum]